MKKFDKFIYALIMILGILAIVVLSYFIILISMSYINSSEFSNLLIDFNIYSFFYQIYKSFNKIAFPLLIFIIFIIIPYLIISIFISIVFIIKYVKHTEKKKKKIIKKILLFISILLLLFSGIYFFPLTNQYEIKINSYISHYSNLEVKEFLEEKLDNDCYVYKVKIGQSFPDDYNVRIYYKDGFGIKVENSFLLDSDYGFIEKNAKNLTDILTFKSIILLTFGDCLYVYFLIYILKEFRRLSNVSLNN